MFIELKLTIFWLFRTYDGFYLIGITGRVADIKTRAQAMKCLSTFSEAVGPDICIYWCANIAMLWSSLVNEEQMMNLVEFCEGKFVISGNTFV